jgi:hypothetical protein
MEAIGDHAGALRIGAGEDGDMRRGGERRIDADDACRGSFARQTGEGRQVLLPRQGIGAEAVE